MLNAETVTTIRGQKVTVGDSVTTRFGTHTVVAIEIRSMGRREHYKLAVARFVDSKGKSRTTQIGAVAP